MRAGHRRLAVAGLTSVSMLLLAACGGSGEPEAADSGEPLSGEIIIDGSSTVAPLTEAVAARFQQQHPDVQVAVGTSGTGGGFEKFCAGETLISDASRQIEEDERQACEANGIEWEEITVANDALTVAVSQKNPVTCVSIDQLKAIYGPDATATSWSEIPDLDAEFDEQLKIFSPGATSGTFDYFTEAVNGDEGAQRTDDVNDVGEDDMATVAGVAGWPGGIGYFGYSFFQQNQFRLDALMVRNADGECVAPSADAAQDGSYNPLARQLYLYVSSQALEQPEVQAFVTYYVDNVESIVDEIGFIPLTDEQLQESKDELARLVG